MIALVERAAAFELPRLSFSHEVPRMREPRCGALVAAYNAGETIHLDLWHPREPGCPNQVELGLVDEGHPADSIVLAFDFERDGWSIRQASQFPGPIDETHGQGWREVAFVKAWGRKGAPDQ